MKKLNKKNQSLEDIVNYIANVVKNRADKGMNFVTELIPEGLIEFILAIKKFIQELNDMPVANRKEFDKISDNEKIKIVIEHLIKENAALFKFLPETVSKNLALESDLNGNVQVSLIATEQLLTKIVAKKLDYWKHLYVFLNNC